MAIEAGRNTSYGGAVVTQKYSPLRDIEFYTTQMAEYGALMTNRLNQLARANIFPQPLLLVTDWDTQIAAVSGHEPPLVIISSNRSKWIAEGVRLSREQWKAKKYEGSNDLNALTGNVAKQTQSPPLYCPQRVEGDRKTYIVVHMHEYHQYAEALADSGMTVVGWSFRTLASAPGPLAGFGASRYAAIEFCKHLRANMAGVKWDYAWLLDDNVVAISGFPGFATVEAALAAAAPEHICAAFQGCANVEGFTDIKRWAEDEIRLGRGKPTVLPETTTPRGIIQQAALWNIKYLADQNLNFAPLFIASGEDVSLSNYFNAEIGTRTPAADEPPIPYYLFYSRMGVKKEAADPPDDSHGAKLVNKARDDYQKWFADEESRPRVEGRRPPPPVEIESTVTLSVSDFITTWFTKETDPKKKPNVANSRDPKVQDKAKCQTVEQVACSAIWYEIDKRLKRYASFVEKEVRDRIFDVPGEHGQVIHRRPPPPKRRT